MSIAFAPCAPPSAGDSFVGGTLSAIECQAQTIGNAGYLALSAPGSGIAAFLTAMLTIFIALIGYRMFAGRGPDIGGGLLIFAKIGIVGALATSWPAFRTLIYDVAIDTPAQLGATVGGAASLAGGGTPIAYRLSETDRALRTLNAWGVGNEAARAGMSDDQGIEPDTTYESKALGAARMTFLAGSLGSIALTRLAAGVLLALGPLFIAFLLFDATRGIFGGWLRGLIGLTLAATASSLVLAVETAIVQPRAVALINLRASGYSIQGAATELLALAIVFAFVTLAVLLVSFYVAAGLRLPRWQWAQQYLPASMRGPSGAAEARTGGQPAERADPRSRAAVIVDAVEAMQRREAAAAPGGGARGPGRARTVAASAETAASRDARRAAVDTEAGSAPRRRTTGRASTSGSRRDER
ncbi:MAG TPA: type IV secretion system protein [Sphingopyxis sp.]|nr:type IV secretion system protein [Sphingopyxis sp.]